jgi:hypothetical protein
MPGSPSADRTARLLLRYARDPSRYRTEARGPDASLVDTDVVLRLAQGRRVELGGPTIEGTDTVALRDAAVGYLREVLFRPDASPYQTLGLAPDVPQDAVKERFRLLMLLVHPDRQGAGPAWPDRCASQANQAYAILRDPGTRAAYDRQEREKAAAAQAAQQAAVAKAAALKSRPSRGSAPGGGARRPPEPPVLPEWLTAGIGGFVREHPAGTAFGALIGAAVLVVGAALWDREGGTLVRASRSPEPPAPTVPSSSPTVVAEAPAVPKALVAASAPVTAKSPATATATAKASGLSPAPAPAPAPTLASSSPSPAAATMAVAPRPAPSAGAVAATVAPAAPIVRPDAPMQAAAARERAAPPELPAAPSRADPAVAVAAPSVPAIVAASVPVPAAVPPSAAAPPPVAVANRTEDAPVAAVAAASPLAPANAEIETFFAALVDAYDRGRVDAYAALFDDDARSNERQGRAAIRRDYEELLRQSAWRRMQITRINWRRTGETARAKGEIAVRIGWRDGREVEQRHAVDMELARRDGRVVITRLSQQPSAP